ncbi:MAG: hypothetical protein EOO62_29695 [Hymenobacter sp.]|nr:MAG: hypothetical protein EOO62_29695 [Hymenobacter sp.]
MTNPFQKPHTVSQWLLGSVCWTMACLGAWWLGWMLLDNVLPKSWNSLVLIGMPMSFCVAHALIWGRAVARGNALIRYDEQYLPFSLTRLAARLWYTALVVVQMLSLVGLLVAGLLMLVDSSPASPGSGEPFFG